MNFLWDSELLGLDFDKDEIVGDNEATTGVVEGLILNATETQLGVDINNDKIVGDNPATQNIDENILKHIIETEYGVDLNKDGIVGDDPKTPDINENIINGIPETKIPWCYAYGEKDWMKPFIIPAEENRDAVRVDYKNRAVAVIQKRLKCGG